MVEVKPYLKILNSTPHDSFINDFNLFLQTDNKLLKTIFTNFKFEPNKEIEDELKNLSKLIQTDLNKLETIFQVGNLIFTKLEEKKITFDDLRIDFEKLEFKKENIEKIKALYDDFGKNYAINRLNYDIIRSNLYLLSPKVTQISYELNIRAIEKKTDEKQEIVDQIPVARIELGTNIEMKGLRGALGLDVKKFTFNATAEDLEKLIDELNKIKLKLSVLAK